MQISDLFEILDFFEFSLLVTVPGGFSSSRIGKQVGNIFLKKKQKIEKSTNSNKSKKTKNRFRCRAEPWVPFSSSELGKQVWIFLYIENHKHLNFLGLALALGPGLFWEFQ